MQLCCNSGIISLSLFFCCCIRVIYAEVALSISLYRFGVACSWLMDILNESVQCATCHLYSFLISAMCVRTALQWNMQNGQNKLKHNTITSHQLPASFYSFSFPICSQFFCSHFFFLSSFLLFLLFAVKFFWFDCIFCTRLEHCWYLTTALAIAIVDRKTLILFRYPLVYLSIGIPACTGINNNHKVKIQHRNSEDTDQTHNVLRHSKVPDPIVYNRQIPYLGVLWEIGCEHTLNTLKFK